MKKYSILLLMLLVSTITMAIPARRVRKSIQLADGTAIEATLRGDENVHFYLSDEGRTFQYSEEKSCYVEVDAASLASRWTQKLEARNSKRKARSERRKAQWGSDSNPISGVKKGIVILVNYTDKKMTYGNDVYNDYFNKPGYNGNGMSGSVHDYFYNCSYGQFDLSFDVVGPVTVSRNLAYYGSNNYAGDDMYAAQMVAEAVQLADPLVNFADYDWDGDGEVDQVYVIYAGYGEAQGGASNTIWPHEYELSEASYYRDGPGALNLDGVVIDTYACSCELNGYRGSKLDGIGTACHEFSHCMCIPDMYDTSGYNFGMNKWDLMDYGTYNGANDDATCPAPYTSYERMYCGWLTPTELFDPCEITDMPAITDAPVAYMIRNSGAPNEYYLLENHQKKGWDKYAGGHGMLVLHVDFDSYAWSQNTVNTISSRQRMTIIAADNSYSSYTLSGDTWPGTSNKTELSNTSYPAAKMYNTNAQGEKLLGHTISDIKEENGLVSFVFDGGSWVTVPDGLCAEEIGNGCFVARWNEVKKADYYEIELKGGRDMRYISKENSYRFRSLSTKAEYSFRVRAMIGDIAGEWSEYFYVGKLEDPDGITLTDSELRDAGRAYNLQGQSVQNPGKGIYIIDGRKVAR